MTIGNEGVGLDPGAKAPRIEEFLLVNRVQCSGSIGWLGPKARNEFRQRFAAFQRAAYAVWNAKAGLEFGCRQECCGEGRRGRRCMGGAHSDRLIGWTDRYKAQNGRNRSQQTQYDQTLHAMRDRSARLGSVRFDCFHVMHHGAISLTPVPPSTSVSQDCECQKDLLYRLHVKKRHSCSIWPSCFPTNPSSQSKQEASRNRQ